MAGLFQVLWGERGGKFKEAAVLNGTDGKPLIIPTEKDEDYVPKICTRPTAVDWNGDGNLDLIVGNMVGTFYLFAGEGKGNFPQKAEALKADGSQLTVPGQHSDPCVVDWDGDGDLDLLSGSGHGGVYWAENTAGKGKTPELKKFEPLIKASMQDHSWHLLAEDELTGPRRSTRVWAEDVNGDGKFDLLIGDTVTLRYLAKGISKEQYAKRLEKWQKEYHAASKATQDAEGDEEKQEAARKQLNKVYEQRTEFMKEDPTGFVWLCLRK